MKMSWRVVVICSLAVVATVAGVEAQTLQTYWADLQGDNRASGSPDAYFSYGRDVANLDVVALTPHASNMTANEWAGVQAAAASTYAPGSFVAYSGFEWNSDWGHKVVQFLTDDQAFIKPNVTESNHPNEFYALLKATNGWGHVAHPSLNSVTTNWNYHDQEVQWNTEIYSRWGSFETHPTNGKAVRDAWARGYRLGVMASSDTDSLPGIEGGVTAILAEELTRESIRDALAERRIYATTGARIDLDFTVDGATFGEIVNDVIGDATISASVQGTAPISRVEVRRNNALVYQFAPAPARVFAEVGGALSYMKGTVEPPANWNEMGFNDAGWLPGRSGIGFGDDDDVTVLSDMEDSYMSVYTRQTFSVTDHAPLYLYLGVDYDDGFIAYIDGVEILRVNMPEGPVTHDMSSGPFREPNKTAMAVTGATSAPFYTNDGTPGGTPTNPLLDVFDISEFKDLLSPGVHVLAIQAHNSHLSSADLTLIPRLYEPNPATEANVNFTDAGAAGDRFYDVKVIQLDGETAWASPVWMNPDAPPRSVATLSDTPFDNGRSLDLSWTKSVASDFGWYNIYVSEFEFNDADGMTPWNDTPIYNADSLSCQIDSLNGQPLVPDQTYYVFVGAFDWPGKMNSATFGVLASGAPSDNLPPVPPTFTSATDTPNDDGGSLQISWGLSPDDGAGVDDVTAYEIFRRTNTGTYGSSPLITRAAGTTTYQDNTTDDTKQYLYKVRATDGKNESAFTAEFGPIASVDNGGVAEPHNVEANDVDNDQGGSIEVTWDLSSDDAQLTRYLVYRSETPGSYGASIGNVPAGTSSFVDNGAGIGTDYYYVVVADQSGTLSALSNEAGPVQSLDNIAPPRIVILDAVDNMLGGSANITWSYDEAAVPDLDRYDIYYKDKSFSGVTTISPIMSAGIGDTLAVVTGLLNDEGYYFTVVPVDASENFYATGLETNWAKPSDTTAPTFAGLENAIPGDASITLKWTPAEDNTLPVEYSLYMSTDPASFPATPSFTLPGATPIVPLGTEWYYHKGITAPPAAWNQVVYNASGWLAGEGAFGYDSHTTVVYETATTFSDMDGNYSSVFFRKDFELASIPENLFLGILVDDGYIAYINGVEVSRDNLDDPVSHISLAEKGMNAPWSGTLDLSSPTNYNPDPILKQIDISDYIGLLSVGPNVLAVQVHNRKKNNPDLLFLATLASANSSYNVTGLDDGTTYYFTMQASDGAGNAENNTAIVSAQPLESPPPAAVSSLSAVGNGSVIDLSWTPVTTDEQGASITPDHYNVYRGTTADFVPDFAGQSNLLASVSGTSYSDGTAMSMNEDLYYRVTAVSASNREATQLSPLGMKIRNTLTHVPNDANKHWISIPYLTGIPDAQTLVTNLNGGPFPGAVTRIERFDPQLQSGQSLTFDNGAWVGENFPIAAGEAYGITLQSDLTLTIVGAHKPDLGFTYPHNDAKSSFYTIGLPIHNDYTDAVDLLSDLNAGAGADNVTKLVRLNAATGEFDSYLFYDGQWLGTNFAITPGQGYAIIVREDINGWKPRTQ